MMANSEEKDRISVLTVASSSACTAAVIADIMKVLTYLDALTVLMTFQRIPF